MRGKLIALEAGDGSGKGTQAEKLYKRLAAEGYHVRKVEFPNYGSASSALVKMYLNGEFGSEPGDVNPYVASTFYTVDRYASYKKEWKEFYENGGIIVADRYTTANMVHQAAKITGDMERENYINWLLDFEFNLFQLPAPDCVIFLDMPPEHSRKLIDGRVNKSGEDKKDIHERDYGFIVKSYRNAREIADRHKWRRIDCVAGGRLKNIGEIHEEIYQVVRDIVSD
ncbi:thymidylate kinase [Pelotomaculum terephthalicicum JT]|uniref:dTMP kinase n=1 Tax=Pelotomaculum TaxID=191373 RepID=UPI0009CE633C|nr:MULTISPECIES: thymidylate kinase [Pelotomaculum]MCG9968767.1 thymidylate kinase [Pelotomaculum terephthalicicum JT]OPX84624.1 MAG: Thymidylate kinase [Pelotomaculum sp. PtaB.Bin117]OPY63333.1 MAG: Thymidylate kinase [Pelotomaculum sp. PtaU1.Bin065]